MQPRPNLAEQNGGTETEPNTGGYHGDDRREQDDENGGSRDVEKPFHRASPPGARPA